MAGPEDRRALTVRLALESGALLRGVTLAEPPPPAIPAPDRAALPGPLDEAARALDGGSPGEVERLVTGEGAARLGQALLELLFGGEAALLALLASHAVASAADPLRPPVRVRVVTADAALAGLPYRLTAFAGAPLVERGWTFEVAHEAALRPPPPSTWNYLYVDAKGTAPSDRLPSDMLWRPAPRGVPDVRVPAARGAAWPRILAATPSIEGAPGAHVRALRQGLAALGYPHDDPERIRVVVRPGDLAQAIAGMRPEIIYIHGSIEASGGGAALALAGGEGGAARLPLAELSRWLATAAPAAIFLATSMLGEGAYASAFRELAPAAPLVALHRAGSLSDDAAAAMLQWLSAVVGNPGDPVLAMHAAASPGPARATACLHAAYACWARAAPPRPPSAFDLALRRALDAQREAALARVAALALDPEARVLALIAPAAPRCLDLAGARPLLDELALAGRHLGRARAVRMPEPGGEAEGELAMAMVKRALIDGLDAGAGLEPALRRLAADAGAPAGERCLLWLDWGARGAEPLRPPDNEEISAWLDVTAEALAARCPPEIRVIASMTVEIDPGRHARVEAWIAARRARLRAASPGFDAALLPGATPLDRAATRACLEGAAPEPCPPELLEELSDRVLARAAGDADATLALVEQARATSWAALGRSLAELTPPEEIEEEIF